MRLMLMFWVLILPMGVAFAQDDDLGEATGLEASTPMDSASSNVVEPAEASVPMRARGYGLLDARIRKHQPQDDVTTNAPNAELSLALDYDLAAGLSVFTEGRGFYEDATEQVSGVFDQGGLRYRPIDALVLVVGKERNRRAPGLIVSPSDFLHSNESVPGLRQERSGVWLARASLQDQKYSLDLIVLPVNKQTPAGFLADDSDYLGVAVRYFQRLPGGIDVGVDVGSIDEELKAGSFIQTIVAQAWKLYAEAGYDEKTKSTDQLFGVGYEGSSNFTVRTEWYSQAESAIAASPLFIDRSYSISSLSFVEIFDRFNVTDTFVRSLASERYFNLMRLDWLVSARHVAGITLINIEPNQAMTWQAIVDWKVNF